MQSMQDQLHALLDQRLIEQQNVVSKQSQSIFMCGLVAGILFSYTGVVGFIAGVFSGIALTHASSEIANAMNAAFVTNGKHVIEYVQARLSKKSR